MNDYIRRSTGGDFTAKDFRTWSGTVLALRSLLEVGQFESEADAKRKVVMAIDRVARELGNTRAVCRRSYVHPEVVEAYKDGRSLGQLRRSAEGERFRGPAGLDDAERLCYALLEQGAARAGRGRSSSQLASLGLDKS